jgi:hypothetical protein
MGLTVNGSIFHSFRGRSGFLSPPFPSCWNSSEGGVRITLLFTSYTGRFDIEPLMPIIVPGQ